LNNNPQVIRCWVKENVSKDEYKAIFESYLVVSNWNKYNKLIAMQCRIAVEESIDYSQARILPGIEQSGHFVISLFVDLPSSSASIFGGGQN
jgi:hypothetical protein